MQCVGGLFLIVTCFVAGFCALSAAQTVGLTVDVPFQFNVGEKVLSAGPYVLLAPQDNTLSIVGRNGMTITAKANLVGGQRPDSPGMVSFNCYGSRCFLSRFWNPRANVGKELLKSRLEKEVAGHGDQLAVIALKAMPYEQP